MRKLWKICLPVMTAVLLLAGCGGQTGDNEQTAQNDATEAPAQTKEPRYAPYFTDKPFEASGVVWIAGDSIASEHDDNEYEVPISGWGVYLGDYLTDGAEVHNEARSGRSSKSYLKENNYKEIIKNMAYGDYLFIAFGLNDEKEDMSNLYTDPDGAEPVLMSPVVRATYDDDQKLTEQTQTAYADAMERLVEEYKEQGIDLYYIDLYGITDDWFEELGYEGVRAIHGVDNEGKDDTTHFNADGAKQLAEKIVEEVKRQQMELSAFAK